jgi:uncharacterized protein YprB with RNaseH-like and TPR domain
MIHLIYIGERFYAESGSMMSSLYTTTGHRYDWGFVQRDLRDGYEVRIRNATHAELVPYERQLAELKARRGE